MDRGLPILLHVLLPKPPGILIHCTVTTNESKALNLELDSDTLSKGLQITYPDNRSFRLKLIPIGLSFRFRIVIPAISELPTYFKTLSKRSFTLARKCDTGSLASEGGFKRTVNCLPSALNRLYFLVCRICEPCSFSLSLSLYKNTHLFRIYTL